MLVYGKQVCLHILKYHKDLIQTIYFGKEIPRNIFHQFSLLQKPIIKPDFKKLQSLCRGGNHQGYLLEIAESCEYDFNFFKGYSKILVLVGITDVGNIGSIFRSALCFGIDGIILTHSFDKSGVARSSSGAFFDMPYCIYKDSLSLINKLREQRFSLFASSPNKAESLQGLGDKWALFLGSEGEGLPNKIIKRLDNTLSIKMMDFDSLNVSVAAGILMYRMVNNELH